MNYLYVAIGGAIGASLRYFVMLRAEDWFGKGMPFGTLAVNVIGSFLLGVFYALMHQNAPIDNAYRAFFAIGVLGAFTTFSTFSFDTVLLLQQGEWLKALANVGLNVFVCIIAAGSAVYLVKG
ncbi:fluoride efflux transporter CrcB [Alteromonas facilis]|uniref:fluoride efflux transporter CrcB n=1 Tax=Alteromonas facilis TaxID=2048004 RepID=UPI000C283313|nr:fluoride efflux transporter CrcB [Alteromonas facilis]